MSLREQEGNTSLAQSPLDLVRRGHQIDAARFQNLGRTGFRRGGLVAVLGDDRACTRRDDGGGCGDVPGAARIAARAARIDGVFRRGDGAHTGAHGARARGQNGGAFANGRKTDQKAANLCCIGFALHQRVEGRLQRFRRGQPPACQGGNGRTHRAHAALPVARGISFRKFFSTSWPCCEAMDSG